MRSHRRQGSDYSKIMRYSISALVISPSPARPCAARPSAASFGMVRVSFWGSGEPRNVSAPLFLSDASLAEPIPRAQGVAASAWVIHWPRLRGWPTPAGPPVSYKPGHFFAFLAEQDRRRLCATGTWSTPVGIVTAYKPADFGPRFPPPQPPARPALPPLMDPAGSTVDGWRAMKDV